MKTRDHFLVRLLLSLFLLANCVGLGWAQDDPFATGDSAVPASEDPFAADANDAVPASEDPFAADAADAVPANEDPFAADAADPVDGKAKKLRGDMAAHWEAKQRRTLTLLEQPTEYEFFETPLDEVMLLLEEKHDFGIYIDAAALEAVNNDSSVVITQTISGVSLRQALRLMLGRHGLAFVVREGTVIVSSAEEVEATLTTQTYAVRDLLHPEHPNESMEQLMDVIMACVAPHSWEQVGGPAAMRSYQGVLVVDQNDVTHQRITQLLRELRSDIQAAGGPKIPVITEKPSSTAGTGMP